MVILTTHYGEPHSVKGLGNWMAATIAQAGLPDRCREPRLAQGSCQASGRSRTHRAPDHQYYGIPKIKEVERYTKAVEQKRRAVAAIEQPVRAENKIVPTLTRKVKQMRIFSIFSRELWLDDIEMK
jgi:hypothetical protein